MEMKTIAFAAAMLTGLAASAVDLTEWRLNSWHGYEPKAQLEKAKTAHCISFRQPRSTGRGWIPGP